MSKQPIMYAKEFDGVYTWGFERVEPTGKCKRLTVTTDGVERVFDYVEIYRTFLGFKIGTKWVSKENIQIRTEKEEIYNCDEN